MTNLKPFQPKLALSASIILVLICIAQFMDGMDASSMGVILPKIQQEFGMSPQSLQWIVSGYVLGFGGFLLLGGRTADLFGKRRVFLLSLLVFSTASLVGGLASADWVLIAARIAKGVSAGFTAPAALALLLSLYNDPAERGRALGIFTATGAVGFSSGLFIGGVLGNLSWRLTLLLPVPIALAVVVLTHLSLKPDEVRDRQSKSFDVLGAILGTISMLSLVFGVTQAATYGWGSPLTVLPIVLSLLLMAAFLRHESRTSEPLMPLNIFRRPGLSFGGVVGFFLVGNYAAFQFVATLYFQRELGWSPLQSCFAYVFGGLMVIFTSTKFAKLASRIGPMPVIVAGIGTHAASYALFLFFDKLPIIPLVAIWQLMAGLGFSAAYPAIMLKGLSGAKKREHGLASGVISTFGQVGSGVILAVTTSVFAAGSKGFGRYREAIFLVFAMASFAFGFAAVLYFRRKLTSAVQLATESELL